MTAQSYHLDFEGYWRERNKQHVPAVSGIYCVYSSTFNPANDTVSLHKLIYIGESENVGDRIANHEKWPRWRRHLRSGQVLSFSCARITAGRERAEAAMIHHHKPPENTEYVHEFPYDTTTITTAGRNALLSSRFTVVPTKRAVYG